MNTQAFTKEFICGKLYRRPKNGQVIMVLQSGRAYSSANPHDYDCMRVMLLTSSTPQVLTDILLFDDAWVEL